MNNKNRLKVNVEDIFMNLTFIFLALSTISYSFYRKVFYNSSIQLGIILILLVYTIILKSTNKNLFLNNSFIIAFFTLTLLIGGDFRHDVNIYFYILSIFLFILNRNSEKSYRIFFDILLIFALINGLVNVIGLVNKPLYLRIANSLMTDYTKEINLYFTRYGQNLGLTNHYSRNAFYTVIGLLIITPKIINKKSNFYTNAAFVFLLFILLLTSKRGHLLYYVFAFLVFLIATKKGFFNKLKNLLIGLVLLLIVVALLIYIFPELGLVFSRFLGENSTDISSGRFRLYEIALDMFIKKPFFGNGYGYFTRFMNYKFAAVHNDYLQFFAEGGIFIGLLMSFFIIQNLYISYKGAKKLEFKNNFANIAFTIQVFLVSYAVTGIVFYDYANFIVYFVAASLGREIYRKSMIEGKNEL